ncbi:zinc finger protein 260-like [Leptopilina heterotoma]|uniref:zinc finger protein 260-like n=1 Tax=Leptopilina heterotoma TaxID=63436 RepID=UPI001CA9A2FD|nr:zinc finger protein 260-like [Leptopilina heterotoma]
MRVKSVPRRVNQNRSEKMLMVNNSEKCPEIGNFLDEKNSAGLDLSTKKKIFENKEIIVDTMKNTKKVEAPIPILPKLWENINKPFQEFQIHNNFHIGLNHHHQENMKDSFLYQIMTDPQFIENLQKNKKKKKPSCQFCKREFETEHEMKEHLNVRLDESNRVTCCACGKSFAQKRYLRYHQRCHSDRSKYVCGICLRKYSRMDNLTRHNIFHTNPDKFPCTMCDRAFARKDLLNKHQKSHENKYKWYCNTCHKYFKGPVTLDNHMKSFHAPDVNYNNNNTNNNNNNNNTTQATCSFTSNA